jgi:large subunit ribosomal protein L25
MATTLNARTRTEHGKGGARHLRQAGLVPAILYGRGESSQPLSVEGRELERLLSSISVENTIIGLAVEGQSETQAIIREVQYHPLRPVALHVDFFKVHATEKLTLDVPVRLNGTPVGVRDDGGVMDQILYSLHVECLPKDIPEAIDIDVANLGAGQSVHVRDISVPNVKILNDSELVITSITIPSAAVLPEGAETEEGIGEVEPALVRDRAEDAE